MRLFLPILLAQKCNKPQYIQEYNSEKPYIHTQRTNDWTDPLSSSSSRPSQHDTRTRPGLLIYVEDTGDELNWLVARVF
ncbi:hypothetical protein H5410_036584 [Solanum commersonii]|uniref:Uncharacterized protein n=1 Tax=Solanum commersonii TaxID=4109 RepID=A0A9J5Y702_SOLCO|nr:hypothetical protein H5410_036584 [Solanum commersonii]